MILCIFTGGEPITASQYTGNGRVTEFKYGKFMGEIFRKQNYQQLSYLRNYGKTISKSPLKHFVFYDMTYTIMQTLIH